MYVAIRRVSPRLALPRRTPCCGIILLRNYVNYQSEIQYARESQMEMAVN